MKHGKEVPDSDWIGMYDFCHIKFQQYSLSEPERLLEVELQLLREEAPTWSRSPFGGRTNTSIKKVPSEFQVRKGQSKLCGVFLFGFGGYYLKLMLPWNL